MNQPNQQPPDRNELRDRLLDAALRERLGGETPPDLSEAILARASDDAAIRSLAAKETTMEIGSSHRRRLGWKGFAIAATMLVTTGTVLLLLPKVQPAREAARRTTPATNSHTAENAALPRPDGSSPMSGSKGEQKASADDQKFLATRGAKVEVVEQLSSTPTVDAEVFKEQAISSGPAATQGKQSDGLMMKTTPHIIIQEEEEDRLGVDESDRRVAKPLAATVENGAANAPSDNQQASEPQMQGGLTATAAAPVPASTAPNSTPFGIGGRGGGMAGGAMGGFGRPTSSPATAPAQGSWDTMYQTELSQSSGAGQQQGQPVAGQSGPEGQVGLQGLINDAYSTESNAWHDQATSRDQYARIHDNPFLPVSAANTDHRRSTFSIDVDTASYANVRQFLTQSGTLPPPDAVRIEELVNYFDYDYTPPTGDVPFAANVEVAGCPWAPEHRLVRIGVKGREMERTQRPLSNLVFLIDVSGSMNEPNKLPLLVEGMKQLTRELGENDRVAIVVYASSEGLALESTLGTDQSKILAALDQLRAGGSTAGGAGIQLAYQVAQRNFIKGAVNRVILCTDGDFNVGVTSPAELERMAETNAKETGVFLTVLGFGRGNLNDAMMEQIADKGNGNYHYIDTQREARKVLVEEMTGTLVAIAKDVKIQIEFNPAQVAGYRLIGYENRVLAAEDFNDDKKDAGEIGAGHTVTALYEIVPAGKPVASAPVDELKYAPGEDPLQRSGNPSEDAKAKTASDANAANELLTLKIRYKAPDGDVSTKLEFPINDAGQTFAQSTDDFKFASAVASFGMLLRDSQHKGNATYAAAAEIAEAASKTHDPRGYRREFVEIVKRAQELSGE